MSTPYTEGRLAGYRNAPDANPYRKGWREMWTDKEIGWAADWEEGYAEGQSQARDDLIAKHREGAR